MQCNHCGKFVPSTSKTCMFCNQVIDPNARYIPPEEDLGSIENTDYDTKLNIKVVNDYIKNPKYKKYLIMGVAFVVLFIALIIGFAISGVGSKKASSDIFIKVTDSLYDYIDDNILSKNGHSGTATLEIKYTGKSSNVINYQFTGDYVFDPLNKYYSYTASLDGKYSSQDIKVDSKILPINILFRDNTIYLNSSELNEKALSGDISFLGDYLNFKDYEFDKLSTSTRDALKETLKELDYDYDSESINYRGEKVVADKTSLVLDSKGMYDFYKKLFANLMDSTKFVNQFGTIRGMEKERVKEYFNDLLKTFEYKYNDSNKDVVTINIYSDSKNVYQINYIYKSNETHNYQLVIKDGSYFFDYFKNDKNVYSGTLVNSTKDLTNKIHGEIGITFDSDDYLTDIKIKYDDDKKPSYKKLSYTDTIDLYEISDEDYTNIKTKLNNYIDETYLFDRFKKLFVTECSSDLECTCSDLTCRCLLEDKYITCPSKFINK